MDAILRVTIALVLVLAALWLAARLARRPLRRRSGALDVLARTQLSRGAAVAVVKVDETALVLGVTDQGVTLLHKADADVFDTAEEPARTSLVVKSERAKGQHERTTDPGGPGGPDDDPPGPLAGSALSPSTWKKALDALRERSVRR
ncbi:flagellar biosynthetic protein FliO [Actinokineospora enzanensis]|uniref:flagellar biosynthetic protein FliO n=1 Tax=Actinokineospora enzanensis TaxID=155975 RepID=UPI0003755A2B|nr:flagellar biosynthetic protein FliO [Actinokineospora enzanensis]